MKLGITIISSLFIVACLPLLFNSTALENSQELRTQDVATPDLGQGASYRVAESWKAWKELYQLIKAKLGR